MGHARPSRQKEGTAWKSKPMVRSVNENDFDRCLAKGFGRSQTTKTAAGYHYRSIFDVCLSAPLIELRLASFIRRFLKLLRAQISEIFAPTTDRWEKCPALGRRRSAVLLDRFLHQSFTYLPERPHAADGQPPQTFVLVTEIEKDDVFACVCMVERGARIFRN